MVLKFSSEEDFIVIGSDLVDWDWDFSIRKGW
jgi:hypothetical protein